MTEQELRRLVREAIARQGAAGPAAAGAAERGDGWVPAWFLRDAAHAQFAVPSGPDGTCVIEPSVLCNHCGYCKSFGH